MYCYNVSDFKILGGSNLYNGHLRHNEQDKTIDVSSVNPFVLLT